MLFKEFEVKRSEAIPAVIGIIAALIGFLVDDPPSVYIGLFILSITIIYACACHKGPKRSRVIVALAFTITFLGTGIRFHYFHLAKERESISAGLEFKAASPLPNDLRASTFTVVNDGPIAIQYRLVCNIKFLVANNGMTVIENSAFRDHIRSGLLESGNDAQADNCLSDISVATALLNCADIDVKLFYSLSDQPNNQQEKKHGFIARRIGNQFFWEDRASEQKVSDCQALVKLPRRTTFDEQLAIQAQAIKVQNSEILQTIGTTAEKKAIAALSTGIMQYADEAKQSQPKESDADKEDLEGSNQYMQQFLAWGKVTAAKFHSTFDYRLKEAYESARKANIDTRNAEHDCSIISEQYPPTPLMTQLCGIAVGQLAAQLPSR